MCRLHGMPQPTPHSPHLWANPGDAAPRNRMQLSEPGWHGALSWSMDSIAASPAVTDSSSSRLVSLLACMHAVGDRGERARACVRSCASRPHGPMPGGQAKKPPDKQRLLRHAHMCKLSHAHTCSHMAATHLVTTEPRNRFDSERDEPGSQFSLTHGAISCSMDSIAASPAVTTTAAKA